MARSNPDTEDNITSTTPCGGEVRHGDASGASRETCQSYNDEFANENTTDYYYNYYYHYCYYYIIIIIIIITMLLLLLLSLCISLSLYIYIYTHTRKHGIGGEVRDILKKLSLLPAAARCSRVTSLPCASSYDVDMYMYTYMCICIIIV